ncbi:hypothetical protein YC2023_076128 [Brassica napus]
MERTKSNTTQAVKQNKSETGSDLTTRELDEKPISCSEQPREGRPQTLIAALLTETHSALSKLYIYKRGGSRKDNELPPDFLAKACLVHCLLASETSLIYKLLLQNNAISGPVPETFKRLEKLQRHDLSNNSFTVGFIWRTRELELLLSVSFEILTLIILLHVYKIPVQIEPPLNHLNRPHETKTLHPAVIESKPDY